MTKRCPVQLTLLSVVAGAMFFSSCVENSSNTSEQEFAGAMDGQSGNEGTSLSLPCLHDEQNIFTVTISKYGECFEGRIVSLDSAGALNSGLKTNDVIGGGVIRHFSQSTSKKGDLVVIHYHNAAEDLNPLNTSSLLSGTLSILPFVGTEVQVDWQGQTYSLPLEDLFGEKCEAYFTNLAMTTTDPSALDDESSSDQLTTTSDPPPSCPQ